MWYSSISGKKLKSLIIDFYGCEDVSQRGSHMKIKFFDGSVIIIPNNNELKEGLFNAILNQIGIKTDKTKLQVFDDLFKKR